MVDVIGGDGWVGGCGGWEVETVLVGCGGVGFLWFFFGGILIDGDYKGALGLNTVVDMGVDGYISQLLDCNVKSNRGLLMLFVFWLKYSGVLIRNDCVMVQ